MSSLIFLTLKSRSETKCKISRPIAFSLHMSTSFFEVQKQTHIIINFQVENCNLFIKIFCVCLLDLPGCELRNAEKYDSWDKYAEAFLFNVDDPLTKTKGTLKAYQNIVDYTFTILHLF